MAVDFDKDDLRRFAPDAREDYLDALVASRDLLDELDITDDPKVFHAFMATTGHESGGFRLREENLNYSAKRLIQIWPSRFPTLAAAAPYARNPEKLANFTYDDARRGPSHKLGNTRPGDGWKYRGRGLIQATGRDQYARVGDLIDVDLVNNPDLAADPMIAVKIAAYLFVDKGCRELAAKGNFVGVTKRINGGTIGLADRLAWLRKAQALFPDRAPRDAIAKAPPAPKEPPKSMATSTTGNTAVVNGAFATGGVAAGVAAAVKEAAADGTITMAEVLVNVASSVWFWGCVISLVTAAYIWLERRKKLVTLGV